MSSEPKYGIGFEYLPLNNWMWLQVLHDTIHRRYSLRVNGPENLLFDNMHVDAVFHNDSDPLADKYPSLDDIAFKINDPTLGKSIIAAGNLFDTVNKAFSSFQHCLEQYIEGLQRGDPKEIAKMLFGGVGERKGDAEIYREIAFEGQIANLRLAAEAVGKQINFLTEFQSAYSYDFQQAISTYQSLKDILTRHLATVERVSALYDRVIELAYDGKNPSLKYGEAPTKPPLTLADSLLGDTAILLRPGGSGLVKQQIERSMRLVQDCAAQAVQARLREGGYCTRPDLH